MNLVDRLRVAGCVFAEDEAALLGAEASDAAHLEQMVRRRIGGEPLEQVVGWAEFAGLRLVVARGCSCHAGGRSCWLVRLPPPFHRAVACSTCAAAWERSQPG